MLIGFPYRNKAHCTLALLLVEGHAGCEMMSTRRVFFHFFDVDVDELIYHCTCGSSLKKHSELVNDSAVI